MASTDPNGDAAASPFYSLQLAETSIGRGIKALNPGGVGAKAPTGFAAHNFLLKHGRTLIMHTHSRGNTRLRTNCETPILRRIQKARTALVLDHPFFGSLLFRLKGRESRRVCFVTI